MQLIDQTNEIKSQNANLQSLVDNLHAEFNQLQNIIDGLKANVDRKLVNQKAMAPANHPRLAHDSRNNQAEQRIAANDSRIPPGAPSSGA